MILCTPPRSYCCTKQQDSNENCKHFLKVDCDKKRSIYPNARQSNYVNCVLCRTDDNNDGGDGCCDGNDDDDDDDDITKTRK